MAITFEKGFTMESNLTRFEVRISRPHTPSPEIAKTFKATGGAVGVISGRADAQATIIQTVALTTKGLSLKELLNEMQNMCEVWEKKGYEILSIVQVTEMNRKLLTEGSVWKDEC